VELRDGVWLLPAPLQYRRAQEDPTAWFDRAETPAGALRVGLAHGPITDFGGRDAAVNLLPPDRARRSGLAYLALGDWHGRLAVDPFTHYSGTPEPDDFGRKATGVALSVELRGAGHAPKVAELAIGRYGWATGDWTLTGAGELEGLLAALAPEVERRNLVARLKLSGRLSLAEKVAVRDRLENGLAHEVRWLDLDVGNLSSQPTGSDLSDIDVNGVLREATERL
jgi:hypothetical protein